MVKQKAGGRGLCFLKSCSRDDMASFLPSGEKGQGTAGKGLCKSHPDTELGARVSSLVLELKCSQNPFTRHNLPWFRNLCPGQRQNWSRLALQRKWHIHNLCQEHLQAAHKGPGVRPSPKFAWKILAIK